MKLTAPAPQHPLRRLKFFRENRHLKNAEHEIKRIEQKYPKLVMGKPKVKEPIKEPEVKKSGILDKIKGWFK